MSRILTRKSGESEASGDHTACLTLTIRLGVLDLEQRKLFYNEYLQCCAGHWLMVCAP